jgi:hypothetical protein
MTFLSKLKQKKDQRKKPGRRPEHRAYRAKQATSASMAATS